MMNGKVARTVITVATLTFAVCTFFCALRGFCLEVSRAASLRWQGVVAQPITIPKDQDGDGVPDQWDNCPINANPVQFDADNDGIGDRCDWNDERFCRVEECQNSCGKERFGYCDYGVCECMR